MMTRRLQETVAKLREYRDEDESIQQSDRYNANRRQWQIDAGLALTADPLYEKAVEALLEEDKTTHRGLLEIMPQLPSDFEPWGIVERTGGKSDCCNCKFHLKLAGKLGGDWGVCANPESPRKALLTFEHQGCDKFMDYEE